MRTRHLIFSDLSGHRRFWIDTLLKSQSQNFPIILHFPQSIMDSVTRILNATEFDFQLRFHPDKSFPKSAIDSAASDDLIIDWDADKRLIRHIFTQKKTRLLLMRPYLQEKSIISGIRYASKMLLAFIYSMKENGELFLLSIPGHDPKIFRGKWVNDYIVTSNLSSQNRKSLELEIATLREELPDKYFLVPGFITARKNPTLILEATRAFNVVLGEKYCVVFAGNIEESLEKSINAYSESRILNRTLSEEEIDFLIDCSSASLLLYTNVSSSGFVLRCLSRARPSILTKQKHWNRISFLYPKYFQTTKLDQIQLLNTLISLYPFKSSEEYIDISKIQNHKIEVMDILL